MDIIGSPARKKIIYKTTSVCATDMHCEYVWFAASSAGCVVGQQICAYLMK
jgi:hypothetical protein